jgi:hypothetical protein
MEYLTALAGGLAELVKQARPRKLEMDLEGNWEPGDVRGYRNLRDAGQILIDQMRLHCLPLEATTFPQHAELTPTSSTVAASVEILIPQCYSRCKRNKKTGEPVASHLWGAPYGPALMQRHGIRRARQVGASWVAPPIVCGLACYAQTFPTHSPQSSMEEALLAARAQGAEEIRYWSAKFVWGPKANAYARSFIGGIR